MLDQLFYSREVSNMSNQSGIVASDKLRSFFGSCRDGRVRLVKVGLLVLGLLVLLDLDIWTLEQAILTLQSIIQILRSSGSIETFSIFYLIRCPSVKQLIPA